MQLRNDTYITDYTVFDLETTGVDASCEILEIAAVKIRGRKIAGKFSILVKPKGLIPIEASCVNHITDDMVKDGASPEEAISKFIEFVGTDRLVGHNIESFDLPVINRYLHEMNVDMSNEYTDSVLLARQRLPHLASRSLEFLAGYYQVPYKNAHRALQDCLINYHVYEHLIWTPTDPKETAITNCPKCQNKVKLRIGKYGKFLGCSKYPECKFTSNL